MKRTQRNQAILAALLAIAVYGRDFFIGRYRTTRGDWAAALLRFQRFELRLARSRFLTRMNAGTGRILE